MSADLLFSAVVGRRYNSKSQLHASEGRASQRGKTKHLCVMFVRQIVDPAEDRPVWINFVLRGKVDEAVVFDVEIRATKIYFLAEPLRFFRPGPRLLFK